MATTIEAAALERDLQREVAGEVRFDDGSRALYATDSSLYRQVPIGVVVPRALDDVLATVAVCREHGAPLLARGCGTSLAGQCCNVAVVIDFSKHLNRVLEVDAERRLARVEPGAVCNHLLQAAAPYGLHFAPAPATYEYATLGGMIGNNSCGARSVRGGTTADNVLELDVLTADGARFHVGRTGEAELAAILAAGGRRGAIYRDVAALGERTAELVRARYPRIPRRVSGYNLDALLPENGFDLARALVGSESTCALILEATVRLIESPPHRALVLIGYADPCQAGDDVPRLLELAPTALEGVHLRVVENMAAKGKPLPGADLLPAGTTWLLLELGGDDAGAARALAEEAVRRVRAGGRGAGARIVEDAAEQAAIWEVRKAGLAATHVPGVETSWPGWEDCAVAPERLGDYLREFLPLVERHGYRYTMWGHFGDGCIHFHLTFDTRSEDGVRRYRAFVEEAAEVVVRHGGSLSGEHGDGQARAELLPVMFGSELVAAFGEFKRIWDPEGRMNPGKVVDPRPLDADLRLGPGYRPLPVRTHFAFAADGGSLAGAADRCFGVGACRRLEGGTMCPSFKATREERHSTRGRAHLLAEMLRGEVITDGFASEAVHEALDLCLSCKGCKHDCPVSVDVAAHKAEFLAHHYQGRLRPPAAYVLGQLHRWARLAELAPGLANAVLGSRWGASAAARVLGLTPHRRPPRFAQETFRAWFGRRAPRPGDREVLLWPDTFNDHFSPEVLRAATRVLERAGFAVRLPRRRLCCGRPLYDFGLLDQARRQLEAILAELRPVLDRGLPVVVLEPSCAAVFRDELSELLPEHPDAARLAGATVTLTELLGREGAGAPALEGPLLLHGHCHQKALWGMDADRAVLAAAGAKVEVPDTGCCGLAGPFGYEAAKYELSMAVGEDVLLPAVRAAGAGTLVVADGFSCRSQIAHGTGRRALHSAEALDRAAGGCDEPAGRRPRRLARWAAAAAAGAGVLLMAVLWSRRTAAAASRTDPEAGSEAGSDTEAGSESETDSETDSETE